MEYDVIGDIHGHAAVLKSLLGRLGYRERDGAFRHPDRRALFMGDFIDRGPEQLETVRIVRSMVESGAALAVMGNHEFNALAWHTADPQHPGEYLRAHTPGRAREHAAFLAATADRPALQRSIIDWFMTLPLWLDLPALRAVHACWHPASLERLVPALTTSHQLTPDVLVAAARKGSPEYEAIEVILKGPEVPLPEGVSAFVGGKQRHEVRTRWWDADAITYRQSAILYGAAADLPDAGLPEVFRCGYEGRQPLFIGHYQMPGDPYLLAPRVACVDFPKARPHGCLVAYRFAGEPELDPAHFVVTG